MSLEKLDNLVKIEQLKYEPFDQKEFDGMLVSAEASLNDVKLGALSIGSKFTLGYGAAHVLSLAAMRFHGYRSDKRYLVFQCLEQTVGLENKKWRVLVHCHNQRNLAEYEGHFEIDIKLVEELIEISKELFQLVKGLGH